MKYEKRGKDKEISLVNSGGKGWGRKNGEKSKKVKKKKKKKN
jgi:hypothetical protein